LAFRWNDLNTGFKCIPTKPLRDQYVHCNNSGFHVPQPVLSDGSYDTDAVVSFLIDHQDPIVITGLGVVSPWGADLLTSWRGALAGRSMAVPWQSADDLPVFPFASQARWIVCPAAELPARDACDPVTSLALTASRAALCDARVKPGKIRPERCACVLGTSKGSLAAVTAARSRPADETLDHWWRVLLGPSVAAVAVANELGFLGPRLCPVAACATGLAAVLRGVELLNQGDCDLALVGSADDSLHPLVLASFQRLGVLAQGEPGQASRPFDRRRTGFVIGAGAGSLILERRSSALARGVTWYAEIVSGALASDPTGLTALDASGDTLARLISAVVPPGKVPDVINLHGTGTRLNDPAECRAIQQVFGSQLQNTLCGSLKGGMGHLLGAAGSVELALCSLMLRDQWLPPNVNLDDVADDCQLPWVRGAAVAKPVTSLLKLSLGFGGHQAALWLERGNRSAKG